MVPNRVKKGQRHRKKMSLYRQTSKQMHTILSAIIQHYVYHTYLLLAMIAGTTSERCRSCKTWFLAGCWRSWYQSSTCHASWTGARQTSSERCTQQLPQRNTAQHVHLQHENTTMHLTMQINVLICR